MQISRLICCDIDGCLAEENTSPLDLASFQKIAAHNRTAKETQKGLYLTLCSARPLPFVEALARMLHSTCVPAVGEGGIWLWDPKDNSWQLDPQVKPEHEEAVQEARTWLVRTYQKKGVQEQVGKTHSISLFHPRTEWLHSLVPEIKRTFEQEGWPLKVSTTWHWINCDLHFVNKGHGVTRVLEHINLPKERAWAIGDTASDLSMKGKLGYFACPQNAKPEVKEEADYIAPYDHIRGVLDILEHIERSM